MEKDYQHYSEVLKHYKNIIFYGASGSGKTHDSIKTIEKLINKKNTFQYLEKENRIKNISFHKMFSYYDFMEKKEDGSFKNGIFKDLCVNASLDIIKSSIKTKSKSNLNDNSKIWKIYLGYRKTEKRVYEQAIKDKEIVLGWLEYENLDGKSYNEIYSMLEIKRGNDEPRLSADVASINAIVNEMKIGDFVLVFQDQNKISDIGVITSNYFHDYGTPYPHKRKVSWIKEFKSRLDISAYNNLTDLRSAYVLNNIDFSDLREIMQISPNLNDINPYFLIIENIDKGDIFSIFGESYELINKRDKSIILHQSDKKFSIPENVYIIGNASKLINDLSLNNKFAFIRSEYKANKIINLKGQTINITNILDKINEKLYKLDFETISYGFIENIRDINDFYNFWYYQLIPYIESLNLESNDLLDIIGESFIESKNDKIIFFNKNDFFEIMKKL